VLHELLPDLRAAVDDLHRRGVHVVADVIGEEPGGARRELRWLQRHGVPRRDGSDQRLQRQACQRTYMTEHGHGYDYTAVLAKLCPGLIFVGTLDIWLLIINIKYRLIIKLIVIDGD
jgi:hypothetical protein